MAARLTCVAERAELADPALAPALPGRAAALLEGHAARKLRAALPLDQVRVTHSHLTLCKDICLCYENGKQGHVSASRPRCHVQLV